MLLGLNWFIRPPCLAALPIPLHPAQLIALSGPVPISLLLLSLGSSLAQAASWLLATAT